MRSHETNERGAMNPANEVKVQCPRCSRRASPQLRAVASGLLAVCPYCLSPYPSHPRRQGSLREVFEGATPRDARIR
jgi:hypothetical protein